MMDKTYILKFCIICVFFSGLFSEDKILWDFGVVIRHPDLQKSPRNMLYPADQKVSQTQINAIISDPFIPPYRVNPSSDFLVTKFSDSLSELASGKTIYQVESMVKKYYLKKNYSHVIELLLNRDLNLLSAQNRSDLEYLLADAFYRIGNYKKAEEQVLSLLKQYKSDRLYFLLVMIYESLGKKNTAKKYCSKLIAHFPSSDYMISAKIKSKILGRH